MREIQYKDFSLDTHQKNWQIKKPNVCQFELTFKCDLHCRHCYTDCYNNFSYTERELDTKKIKRILDKVHESGVIWLCFTGGDPLTRDDFLEIYSCAKQKGFIITIFTNAYSMTEEIADFLERYPPFVIEITLNAVTKKLYDYISQVKGSYERVHRGLDMILERKLPLKIKTQITKDNFIEREAIKQFVESLGLMFRPSFLLYPRLNSDSFPCSLRISPEQSLELNNKVEPDCLHEIERKGTDNFLFRCAAGRGDGFYVDPYGNMFLCNLLRQYSVNLLSGDVKKGMEQLSRHFIDRRFTTDSECAGCNLREVCLNCPGNAYLETGNEEVCVEYFCSLVNRVSQNIGVRLFP